MILVPIKQNVTELQLHNWFVLFSYMTPVVAINRCSDIVYVTNKKYSAATTRHIKNYLKLLTYSNDYKLCDQEFLDRLID